MGLIGGQAASTAASGGQPMTQGWNGTTGGGDPTGGAATQGWNGVTGGGDPSGGAASQGWNGVTGGGDPTSGAAGQGWNGVTGGGDPTGGAAGQGWNGVTSGGSSTGWTGATGLGGSALAHVPAPTSWIDPVASAGGALVGAAAGSAGVAAVGRRRSRTPEHYDQPLSQSQTPPQIGAGVYRNERDSESGRPFITPPPQQRSYFYGVQQPLVEAGHQSSRPSLSEAGGRTRSELSGGGLSEIGGLARSELSGDHVNEAPVNTIRHESAMRESDPRNRWTPGY
jgi:hypothetical protein